MSYSVELETAVALIKKHAMDQDAPIMICGNGGSASDAQHIAAELVGAYYQRDRPPINAIALSSNMAVMTAISNDYGFEKVFVRQVQAHGRNGGVLLCLSTSGTSANVLQAALEAMGMGIPVIAFTGKTPNPLAELARVAFVVNSDDTPCIQEVHETIYHRLCQRLENIVT